MATKKKTVRRPAVTAADVAVKIDAKLKKRYDESMAVVEKALGEGARAFDELYETVEKILDSNPPLYVVGGHANSSEFCREVLKLEERTVRRWVRVAKFASPAEEERYGVTTLDAVLTYLETLNPLGNALPVAFDRLRIPVEQGGTVKRLAIEECTTREILAAAQKKRGGKGAEGPKSPVRDALQKLFATFKSLSGVGVHEKAGVASFTRVPVAAINTFGRVLSAAEVFRESAVPNKVGKQAKKRSKKSASGRKKPTR